MSTGWFGVPGKTPPVKVKVHVFDGATTLCGWKPGKSYEYQWCAHGINLAMIECSRCREAARKIMSRG